MNDQSKTNRGGSPLLQPLMVILLLAAGCGPGRPPIPPGIVPEAMPVSTVDEQYGQQVLGTLTQKYPLERDDAKVNRVRDIVDRLAKAAHADREPWHVHVLRGDEVVNAAATRGNYVFVWTGMLNFAQTETDLATVLAHEIGHVLADHTSPSPAEEAAEIMAQASGQIARDVLASQGQYGIIAGLAGMALSEGMKAAFVNPESQRKELEADHIGLFLMADAGYDPARAVGFWERGLSDPRLGSAPLEFLSSHPSTQTRIDELASHVPEAVRRYRGERRPPRAALADLDRRDIERREPSDNEWVVVDGEPAVYDDPHERAPVISKLRRGDRVSVVGRQGSFLRIEGPLRGWVRGAMLSPSR